MSDQTIKSADEFLQLRTSDDPVEYRRAANSPATDEVWLDVIERFPEMREWVAHNKTISQEIIEKLSVDESARVRYTIAQKRKVPEHVLRRLAVDNDDGVRLAVARHPKAPHALLTEMLQDDWEEVRLVAKRRLN